jgi:hypothetical protein
MKRRLAVAVASLLALAVLAPAIAQASPRLWTDFTKTTPLRDLKSEPSKFQPDELEFHNETPVTLEYSGITLAEMLNPKVTCTEVQLGTIVFVNNGVQETTLTLPFGVAEGDNCLAGETEVPTYFDTRTNGVVPATITMTGAGEPFTATLHLLKLSENFGSGEWCTIELNGITGSVENVLAGLVEESPPNLKLKFGRTAVPAACVVEGRPKKTNVAFEGVFFLETPSTLTDTAFVG